MGGCGCDGMWSWVSLATPWGCLLLQAKCTLVRGALGVQCDTLALYLLRGTVVCLTGRLGVVLYAWYVPLVGFEPTAPFCRTRGLSARVVYDVGVLPSCPPCLALAVSSWTGPWYQQALRFV